MRFESQTFWIPKDADCPEEYQDAFSLDGQRGVAAVADGVTSAIFSGPWARLVTEKTVVQPPNLEDIEEFQVWITRLQEAWWAGIDISRLTFFQREKLRTCEAGMTTLLWVELTPHSSNASNAIHNGELKNNSEDLGDASTAQVDEVDEVTVARTIEVNSRADGLDIDTGPPAYQLRCYSRGDCELFHIRDGQLLTMFPMDNSADFGLNPAVLSSMDRSANKPLEFLMIESECRIGDLLVLCTDALALWAINMWEMGQPVDWQRYWDMPSETWREEMFALRRDNRMRFDDTTLLLLRVIEEHPEAVPDGSGPTIAIQGDRTGVVSDFALEINDLPAEEIHCSAEPDCNRSEA